MIPKDGACQDAMYNKWELINMKHFMFNKIGIADRLNFNLINRNQLPKEVTDKPIIVSFIYKEHFFLLFISIH